jgi:hypothetical protein
VHSKDERIELLGLGFSFGFAAFSLGCRRLISLDWGSLQLWSKSNLCLNLVIRANLEENIHTSHKISFYTFHIVFQLVHVLYILLFDKEIDRSALHLDHWLLCFDPTSYLCTGDLCMFYVANKTLFYRHHIQMGGNLETDQLSFQIDWRFLVPSCLQSSNEQWFPISNSIPFNDFINFWILLKFKLGWTTFHSSRISLVTFCFFGLCIS